MLAYDRHRGQHHILFEDGEDEAVRLTQETVRWHGPAALGPCAAGMPPGVFLLTCFVSAASALLRVFSLMCS